MWAGFRVKKPLLCPIYFKEDFRDSSTIHLQKCTAFLLQKGDLCPPGIQINMMTSDSSPYVLLTYNCHFAKHLPHSTFRIYLGHPVVQKLLKQLFKIYLNGEYKPKIQYIWCSKYQVVLIFTKITIYNKKTK